MSLGFLYLSTASAYSEWVLACFRGSHFSCHWRVMIGCPNFGPRAIYEPQETPNPAQWEPNLQRASGLPEICWNLHWPNATAKCELKSKFSVHCLLFHVCAVLLCASPVSLCVKPLYVLFLCKKCVVRRYVTPSSG